MPEDVIIHSHRRENLKSYTFLHSFSFLYSRVLCLAATDIDTLLKAMRSAKLVSPKRRGNGVTFIYLLYWSGTESAINEVIY
jgi:hypothetical protein